MSINTLHKGDDDDDGNNNGETIFSLQIKTPKHSGYNEPYRRPKFLYFTRLCMSVSYTSIHTQP